MTNKKQIALRFDPSLVKRIDDIRPHTHHPTRTELIETACIAYVSYLRYCLEEEALEK
jgi:metal-responsive CopG/Arc/MetJ family transcriptional regulator